MDIFKLYEDDMGKLENVICSQQAEITALTQQLLTNNVGDAKRDRNTTIHQKLALYEQQIVTLQEENNYLKRLNRVAAQNRKYLQHATQRLDTLTRQKDQAVQQLEHEKQSNQELCEQLRRQSIELEALVQSEKRYQMESVVFQQHYNDLMQQVTVLQKNTPEAPTAQKMQDQSKYCNYEQHMKNMDTLLHVMVTDLRPTTRAAQVADWIRAQYSSLANAMLEHAAREHEYARMIAACDVNDSKSNDSDKCKTNNTVTFKKLFATSFVANKLTKMMTARQVE